MVPPTLRRRITWMLPAAWAVVILVLTLTPAASMPPTPQWRLLSFDTAAHASVFVVLAVLAYFPARQQQYWRSLRLHPGPWLLVAGSAFGLLIELLQTLMHLGRHGEWTDGLSDALGMALGLGLAWLLAKRFSPR